MRRTQSKKPTAKRAPASKPEPEPKADTGLVARVAGNLRAVRKARGLSQADLAQAIGAHLTHVNRVETGKYAPSLEFVVKAAEALEVSLDVLLAESETEVGEVRLADKQMAERVRLIETLDEHERTAVVTVIESMLTKHRMRALLSEGAPSRQAS
jgi:transcriptional regulator with XRE-family HTH domain